jgi:hypothetical protein
MRLAVALLAIFAVTACTPASQIASSAAPAMGAPAGTCAVTTPRERFVPRDSHLAPATPPPAYAAEWFGDARLWTMLPRTGEVWDAGPQKTFWWSEAFDFPRETKPMITLTARRVDGPGQFETPAPGTNAEADFGAAMLTGIGLPTGCWEITATYRGVSLSYVARVK